MIRPQDIVHPGPHLPPLSYHTPHPPVLLWIRQVRVHVSHHQKFGSLGELLEHFNDPLYCQGVVGGEVTSHDVPPPRPLHQLEADDAGDKLLDGLHRKMRYRPMEDCHSAAVLARHVRRNNAIPSRPAGVDTIRHFCLLKYAQVHVGLEHPP